MQNGQKLNAGNKVLEKFKQEISNEEWNRYIKHLKYDNKASRSDIAQFYAPNILVSKWIKTRYSKKMEHIFELENNTKPKIIISIASNQIENNKLNKRVQTESKREGKSTILNPSFTFESFIIGGSNQFAYTTAKSVAEKPGELYNPLFIYGGVGLGKTHLIQAIGNYQISKGKKVIYTTFEQFMNKFTSHLRSQTMDRFREHFRECDILIIDDIQFLSKKEQTQEEFFHTFNELHQANKQIIITSDRQPNKISGLVDRLKSRFEWGLMADIQPPELETKIAIIQNKCEIDGINLNRDIINFLASNMGHNIREIEGAIIKLNAYSGLMNQDLTLEFAQNVIREQLEEKQSNISIDDIVQRVAKEQNVKLSDIRSKKRSRDVVKARRMSIYLARNLTPNSMPQIALYFGMKDHTTVSHTMRKIKELLEEDKNFKLLLEELSNKINYSKSKHD
jgi:chromosomal replication initiator protein